MSVNAREDINEEWSEPAIIWNVVASRKGEIKTAAMKRLLSAIEVMQYKPSNPVVSLRNC